MEPKPLTLDDVLNGPVDPLYDLLAAFEARHKVSLPTATLADGDVDELRRLLVSWDTGGPGEHRILEFFGV